MAMDGDQMGKEIAEAIMNAAAPPDVQANVIALWKKISGAIVKHIQDNAEVPAGIAVSISGDGAKTTEAGALQ